MNISRSSFIPILWKGIKQVTLPYNEKILYFFMQSGKSALSNFLADATETASGDYHPTQGVR